MSNILDAPLEDPGPVTYNPETVISEPSTPSRWSRLREFMATTKFRICIVAAVWGFLTGVERAIILPTLYLYFFTKFNNQIAFQYYGLTLGAFNLAMLLFSPLYGWLSYRGIPVKILLIVSNQLEIIGNVIYYVGQHPWLILIGRFISGVGAGSEVPLFADIVRVTSKEERTPYLVALLMGRQLGLIIGPACTLIMHRMDLKVLQVRFTVYNGPGLFMAVLWAVHTFLTLLVYVDVDENGRPVVAYSNGKYQDQRRHGKKKGMRQPPEDVTKPLLAVDNTPGIETNTEASNAPISGYKFYLQPKIIILLAFTFASYYSLMALESVLSPAAKQYFDWSEVQVSYVYLVCGVAVIFVYGTLRWLSFRFEDRHLLIFGVVVLLVAYSLQATSFLAIDPTHSSARRQALIGLILFGVALHVLGQPFCVACPESLYTKLCPVEDMDRAQTILRTVMNVAFVIGPFVGGSLSFVAYVVFLSMLVCMALPLGFFLMRLREYVVPGAATVNSPEA